MNQSTKKTPTDDRPVLREPSASECEAVAGGYDDTLFCGTPWSKVPPYPPLNSAILVGYTGTVLVR
jgi:hypothetical protein